MHYTIELYTNALKVPASTPGFRAWLEFQSSRGFTLESLTVIQQPGHLPVAAARIRNFTVPDQLMALLDSQLTNDCAGEARR